jgi:hypothetical protein
MSKLLTRVAPTSVAFAMALAGVAYAEGGTSSIHDGVYASHQGAGAQVNLYVDKNGKELGKGSVGDPYAQSVTCPVSSVIASAGYDTLSTTTIAFAVPYTTAIPIRNGKFSYTGPAYVDPSYDTTAGMNPNPGTITISGRFKTSGHIKNKKTIAVTGTVSESLCGTTIPTTFSLYWQKGLQHG